MTAAIWSTPPDKAALDFPAFTLLRFMHNHHLLQILDRPTWLTLANGSHSYVNAVLAKLPKEQYHQNVKIVSASTSSDSKLVTIESADGKKHIFDHVIFACHADQTFRILENGKGMTKQEREVLGGFEFGGNRAVLHADVEVRLVFSGTCSIFHADRVNALADAETKSYVECVELSDGERRTESERQFSRFVSFVTLSGSHMIGGLMWY